MKKVLPVVDAAITRDVRRIVELARQEFDLNEQDSNGFTPLHFAAVHGFCDVGEVLLLNGAKVDLLDAYGNTPLFRAVFNSRGNGDFIELLLKYGADMNCKNSSGISPLELAKTISNYSVLQFLTKE